jgi:hypothetical protein
MTNLEQRYRRLVATYPREHQERHGEEMLGVLLAGADKHARPGLRETVDLLWGAARLHLRRAVPQDGIPVRDALAVVALLGPLAMLLGATSALRGLASRWQTGTLLDPASSLSPDADGLVWQWSLPDLPVWTAWLVVAVLALFRLRRMASVGAWLATAGFVSVPLIEPGASTWWLVWHAGSVVAGIVVAVALTWSPGPARGWDLVGRKRFTLFAGMVVATVALFTMADRISGSAEVLLTSVGSVVLVAGTVLAGGAWSRIGRRAALVSVLALPVVLPAVLLFTLPLELKTAVAAVLWYGVLAVAALAVIGPARMTAVPSA